MYIIGDVHGCYKTLLALLDKLPKDAKICFVGDLIDRGPDSAKVVQLVIDNNYDCVLGNHEKFMIDYVPFTDQYDWVYNGGYATLDSYTDDNQFNEHIAWMKQLPYYIEYPELTKDCSDLGIAIDNRYLLVSHSSYAETYSRDKHNQYFKEDDIIWNRDVTNKTLRSANPFFNVFGHSVQSKPIIEHYFACIDTGAVYTNSSKHGILTAIHFPSMKVVQQINID